jgi:hypothetical protein
LKKGEKSLNMITRLLLVALILTSASAFAGKDDCKNIKANKAPKQALKVGKEKLATTNDYDKVVEEDKRKGVVYLAFIGGGKAKPNGCGLNPSNDKAMWTGWGGPIDCDNCTIGEGAGTRNEIVIGGTYFERGIGTHGKATIEYDLATGNYVKFEGYVGMSDEKDPGGCGKGGTSTFEFLVDKKSLFKTKDPLAGSIDGKENTPPLKVEFDIPAGAKKLTIEIGDGGDGVGCDHSALGDTKLLTPQALTAEPEGKLPTVWGAVKSSY